MPEIVRADLKFTTHLDDGLILATVTIGDHERFIGTMSWSLANSYPKTFAIWQNAVQDIVREALEKTGVSVMFIQPPEAN